MFKWNATHSLVMYTERYVCVFGIIWDNYDYKDSCIELRHHIIWSRFFITYYNAGNTMNFLICIYYCCECCHSWFNSPFFFSFMAGWKFHMEKKKIMLRLFAVTFYLWESMFFYVFSFLKNQILFSTYFCVISVLDLRLDICCCKQAVPKC